MTFHKLLIFFFWYPTTRLMSMRQSDGIIHHCATSPIIVSGSGSHELVRVRPTSQGEIPFEVRPMKESQGECRDIGCPELNFETATNTTLDPDYDSTNKRSQRSHLGLGMDINRDISDCLTRTVYPQYPFGSSRNEDTPV